MLVGVSSYPLLKGRDLKGPRNHVRLVSGILRARGFEAGAIRVLANGVAPGPPAAATRDTTSASLLERAMGGQEPLTRGVAQPSAGMALWVYTWRTVVRL